MATKPSAKSAADFFTVETVHQARVAFWWTQEKLHDNDYHIQVSDAMNAKIRQLEEKYDVTNDTRHVCQWEGYCFLGDKLASVEAAAKELAQHLIRFGGVVPLPADLR